MSEKEKSIGICKHLDQLNIKGRDARTDLSYLSLLEPLVADELDRAYPELTRLPVPAMFLNVSYAAVGALSELDATQSGPRPAQEKFEPGIEYNGKELLKRSYYFNSSADRGVLVDELLRNERQVMALVDNAGVRTSQWTVANWGLNSLARSAYLFELADNNVMTSSVIRSSNTGGANISTMRATRKLRVFFVERSSEAVRKFSDAASSLEQINQRYIALPHPEVAPVERVLPSEITRVFRKVVDLRSRISGIHEIANFDQLLDLSWVRVTNQIIGACGISRALAYRRVKPVRTAHPGVWVSWLVRLLILADFLDDRAPYNLVERAQTLLLEIIGGRKKVSISERAKGALSCSLTCSEKWSNVKNTFINMGVGKEELEETPGFVLHTIRTSRKASVLRYYLTPEDLYLRCQKAYRKFLLDRADGQRADSSYPLMWVGREHLPALLDLIPDEERPDVGPHTLYEGDFDYIDDRIFLTHGGGSLQKPVGLAVRYRVSDGKETNSYPWEIASEAELLTKVGKMIYKKWGTKK